MRENKKQTTIMIIISIIILILLIIIIPTNNKIPEDNNQKEIHEQTMIGTKRYSLDKYNRQSEKTININLEAKESKVTFDNKNINMYTYNDLSPGPIIRVQEGDILNATLINSLKEDTTIHWHGLQIPNEMDGVPDITQDPVKPGETFNYIFKLNNPGIYWYHSHVNTAEQVGRGLYGILIVEEKNNSVTFDKEQLLILDDIRLDSTNQIAKFGSMMDTRMSGRYGNKYFINGENGFEIKAEKNSLLKIDLVNTANARIFQFGIENYKFVVLGNDIGKIENPYETDSLILAPGERAEVLVYLNNTNKNQFNLLNLASRNPDKIGALTYTEEKNIDKTNNSQYYESIIKEKLNSNLPDWSDKLGLEPNISFDLYAINSDDGFKWTINGNYYPEKPDIQNLTKGKFYKIRYTSKQNMIHPMHLHGQRFIILARNGIPENDTMYRDTALVFPGESVDIGLIAQGEGEWVNHCHILEHAEAGMLGVVKVN